MSAGAGVARPDNEGDKVLLTDFIDKYYGGVKAEFARANGVSDQQVTPWIKKGWMVIDGKLWSPKRELAQVEKAQDEQG